MVALQSNTKVIQYSLSATAFCRVAGIETVASETKMLGVGVRAESGEHFTVDGTLIEVWASLKSFQRKDLAEDESS